MAKAKGRSTVTYSFIQSRRAASKPKGTKKPTTKPKGSKPKPTKPKGTKVRSSARSPAKNSSPAKPSSPAKKPAKGKKAKTGSGKSKPIRKPRSTKKK